MTLILLALVASASEPISSNPQVVEASATPPASVQDEPRYALGVRSRFVSIPAGILDNWFDNGGDNVWPLPGESRPKALAYTIGLTFTAFHHEHTLLDVYVEYVGSLMKEGYWDDRDNPPNGLDGTWLRPSRGFGAVVVGFNAFHDVPMVHAGQTNDAFAMSFIVGGGLGLAILTGRIDEWRPSTAHPLAYLRAKQGVEPDGKLRLGSPVWPAVDFELGFRMIFARHVALRLVGGLHSGLSVGGNLTAMF